MRIRMPNALPHWRELAKEVGIIVLGVLIALLAQQLVEGWQWRHKIRASEAAMRSELLFDDGPQIYQRVAMHPCLMARLDGMRDAVERGATRQELGRLADSYWVDSRTFDRLALDAANASDVASHMPQQELDPYSAAYERIPLLDRTNAEEGADIARLQAFTRTGGPMTVDEKDRLLEAVGALRNDDFKMSVKSRVTLAEVAAIGPLDAGRVRRFMADARSHYGDCVQDLPVATAVTQ